MKELYTENYKTVERNRRDTNKSKDIHCSWLDKLTLLKYQCCPKPSSDLNQSLSKFQLDFPKEEKNNPEVCIDPQKTPNSQSNMKKNKIRGITLTDCKLYYKDIVSNIEWYWCKDRYAIHGQCVQLVGASFHILKGCRFNF